MDEKEKLFSVSDGPVHLVGRLLVPDTPKALIIFSHANGSARISPRINAMASDLSSHGFATMIFDLLTQEEATDRTNIFDIPLLATRLLMATRWARGQLELKTLPIGYFGTGTGSAAALLAGAMGTSDDNVYTVVSRGGRPDLCGRALKNVDVPVLLLVGELDKIILDLNRQAERALTRGHLSIVPNATHLFEEPGTHEVLARKALHWFTDKLTLSSFDIPQTSTSPYITIPPTLN